MFHQPDLFEAMPAPEEAMVEPFDMPELIERIADISSRPRYTFMVLNLIAKVAGSNSGSAGSYVIEQSRRVPMRDWLCDSLVPMAKRDPRRLAIVAKVRDALSADSEVGCDATEFARLLDDKVKERVRGSGRCNVSRAVSDLVRAGLVRRHYQGYRIDNQNRGAQREAVYTILPAAARALAGR